MVADEKLLDLFRDGAAEIVAADARALAEVLKRVSHYAGLDRQPALTAMALERRAIVATEMRRLIAPRLGWSLVEDNLSCGAYEWLVDDVVVRLSKTTAESRLAHTLALQGIQDAMFTMPPSPGAGAETALIRLMGNPLEGASVDVGWAKQDSVVGPISLSSIAKLKTERFPGALPSKTTVTLPGQRDIAQSG